MTVGARGRVAVLIVLPGPLVSLLFLSIRPSLHAAAACGSLAARRGRPLACSAGGPRTPPCSQVLWHRLHQRQGAPPGIKPLLPRCLPHVCTHGSSLTLAEPRSPSPSSKATILSASLPTLREVHADGRLVARLAARVDARATQTQASVSRQAGRTHPATVRDASTRVGRSERCVPTACG